MSRKNKIKRSPSFSSSASSRGAEFNPDYSYVKRDLKRIGLLTASMFTVLIVLSFILK